MSGTVGVPVVSGSGHVDFSINKTLSCFDQICCTTFDIEVILLFSYMAVNQVNQYMTSVAETVFPVFNSACKIDIIMISKYAGRIQPVYTY